MPDGLEALTGDDVLRYRSDVGALLYVTPSLLDIAFIVKLLAQQINKPSKLGEARLRRLARYLRSSSSSRSPSMRPSCVGKHLVETWVTTDQVRALSSAEAELYSLVGGAARGFLTKHLMD